MKKNLKITLFIYTIIFFILWTTFETFLKDKIDIIINNEYLSQFIKSGIIKNLVWTIPALILIKHYDDKMYIKLKEMFTTKINFKKILPIFLICTIYVFLGSILYNGSIKISPEFKISDLIWILFVGLTEELVFRGWLLNATFNEKKKYFCVFMNAILFVLIHFPRFINEGILIENILNLGFLQIIILSSIFSYLFLKNKNILVPIFLHMYYDLLVSMFI